MKNYWILKNGASTQEFDSFPLAFRVMFAIAKKMATSPGGAKVIEKLSIISPIKDAQGDPRKYSYAAALEFAKASEVLDSTGQINSNVFKNKYLPRRE
jgi:hypothetical protein